MSIIRQWRQREVIAEAVIWTAAGMERAAAFAAEEARKKVPVRTGLTKRDIRHEVIVRGLTVTGYFGVFRENSKAFYAKFIEWGTSKMAARPFLRPAILENRRKIMKLIAGE